MAFIYLFFFSSRRRHTRYIGDWSSDVCSSDLPSRAGRHLKAATKESRGGLAAYRHDWKTEIAKMRARIEKERTPPGKKIGRASCRERVEISVGALAHTADIPLEVV